MTGVISLAMLQAMEVDPDPVTIPAPPQPLERLGARPSQPELRSVWTLLTRLLRRGG